MVFLPYELPYWQQVLVETKDRALPFSRRVLEYYADARVVNLTNIKTGLVTRTRNDFQIPVDRKVFERTLSLLSADFPVK